MYMYIVDLAKSSAGHPRKQNAEALEKPPDSPPSVENGVVMQCTIIHDYAILYYTILYYTIL